MKVGRTGACRRYGEKYISRNVLIFMAATYRQHLQNTKQFQAVNSLKCSVVGNLGS